jgi:hypothetical protein
MVQDRDPGAAILKLVAKNGEFRFLCPAEMNNVYSHSNNYEPQTVYRSGNLFASEEANPNPPTMLWNGGSDGDVTLDLLLVVGASIDIDTPGQLMDTMNKLAALVQCAANSAPPQKAPALVKLQIGTWFVRKAVVLSGTYGFKRPWDPGTGLPYQGTVSLTLKYLYDQLPSIDTFRFDRT